MEQGDTGTHGAQSDHTGDTTQFTGTGPTDGDSETDTLLLLVLLKVTDTTPVPDTLPVGDTDTVTELDIALVTDAVLLEMTDIKPDPEAAAVTDRLTTLETLAETDSESELDAVTLTLSHKDGLELSDNEPVTDTVRDDEGLGLGEVDTLLESESVSVPLLLRDSDTLLDKLPLSEGERVEEADEDKETVTFPLTDTELASDGVIPGDNETLVEIECVTVAETLSAELADSDPLLA